MSVCLKPFNFRFPSPSWCRFYCSKTNLKNLLENMPKEPKHIAEAQKQRNKIKEKYSKYVPGKVMLQVLGTGAKGAPRSLYMFSDQSRYLFNCGEGTQRLAHEHRMKLSRLEHIFITQPVWKNIGGLPGTALTIQDVGVPEITLHGPKGLDKIFVATKRFVVIKDLQIKMVECTEQSRFEDNVMSVTYVPLTRQANAAMLDGEENSKEIQTAVEQTDAATSASEVGTKRRSRSNSLQREEIFVDDTDYYAHEQSGKRKTPEKPSVESQQLLVETKEQGISMCYICRLQPRPGMLNLDECVKRGVPPGPLLGKLKNGEDVVLPNGTTVYSKDVCEPDDPGPVFIVVDCPSEDYLNSLVLNDRFKQYQNEAKNDDDLAYLVVHFTPTNVMQNERYKSWIDQFSLSTQHLVMNESNTCMGSLSVHKIQHKLNMLSEELFPLLKDDGTPTEKCDTHVHLNKKLKSSNEESSSDENGGSLQEKLPLENLSVKSPSSLSNAPYIFANTFCNFHLRPKKGVDSSSVLKIVPSEYIEESLSVEGFPESLQDLRQKWASEKKKLGDIRPYPRLLFLGTGSCIPNKTRNTSGILLQTSENQNILLDCGEGTCGQIVRFFGKENADQMLANISAVYISHLHADHHIGLVGLLQGRRKALENLGIEANPVYLFAPKQILAWLYFYDKCFENVRKEFQLVANSDLINQSETFKLTSQNQNVFDKLGMQEIATCFVRHCPNAFGVAFKHKSGYKITYSGDTMPSDNLIELGKDSDLLIHEATMEDELAQEAIVKMHSTTSQAINVGKKMNAKHILLTHFSQRYAKLPRFHDNLLDNVGIAFDNMQVRLDELSLVPLLYPALKLMFAEHCEELEHKAVKRQLRIEKERELSVDRKQKEKCRNFTVYS